MATVGSVKLDKFNRTPVFYLRGYGNQYLYRESVAGSVIQATGTVEFEDGLRTGVLPGGCWCPCGGRT